MFSKTADTLTVLISLFGIMLFGAGFAAFYLDAEHGHRLDKLEKKVSQIENSAVQNVGESLNDN